jgi:transcriptional regulator with XRE-family HTH domain
LLDPIKGGIQEMRKWVRSPSYRAAIAQVTQARKRAGFTQRALAEALGKPPSFVAKVEQGERRLDILEFIAIARAIGIREVDLIRVIAADLPKHLEI